MMRMMGLRSSRTALRVFSAVAPGAAPGGHGAQGTGRWHQQPGRSWDTAHPPAGTAPCPLPPARLPTRRIPARGICFKTKFFLSRCVQRAPFNGLVGRYPKFGGAVGEPPLRESSQGWAVLRPLACTARQKQSTEGFCRASASPGAGVEFALFQGRNPPG